MWIFYVRSVAKRMKKSEICPKNENMVPPFCSKFVKKSEWPPLRFFAKLSNFTIFHYLIIFRLKISISKKIFACSHWKPVMSFSIKFFPEKSHNGANRLSHRATEMDLKSIFGDLLKVWNKLLNILYSKIYTAPASIKMIAK